MSEFYLDYSDEQIEEVIEEKLKIYPEDLGISRYNKVDFSDSYMLQYYAEYHGLDADKYKMYKYFSMYMGDTIYCFFNIVKK